ncbi:hypothetical protein GCM10010112_89440 [Actinoplanes lobatus]|uniref:TetR family transcriptional regulator n=1 Tax=Actinoplanes lobatus TaxID=113568 RepID=A0A7W7MIR5_9ACTN|nr:hypothetical protein [Actinoplanes lobatus]MBB4751847.1 hypothetical protein [Actinoplanes lobatus]GGN97307.1 hypothetical protein GCM10010112_89440 [Actinoplanes lobatus]GIE45675.1 hypothetical protein Alo02nite_85730 [Actinoplanes lobatus]
MSLYHHLDGRDALLDAITESVLAGIDPPPPTGVFADDVRALAVAFRAVALRHPRCAPLVLTRQLGSFAGLRPA